MGGGDPGPSQGEIQRRIIPGCILEMGHTPPPKYILIFFFKQTLEHTCLNKDQLGGELQQNRKKTKPEAIPKEMLFGLRTGTQYGLDKTGHEK